MSFKFVDIFCDNSTELGFPLHVKQVVYKLFQFLLLFLSGITNQNHLTKDESSFYFKHKTVQ